MKSPERGKTNLRVGVSKQLSCYKNPLHAHIFENSTEEILLSTTSFIQVALMEITITMLNGSCVTLTVNPGDTVASLKGLIQRQMNVPPQCQKLTICNGQVKILTDNSKPLSYYGLVSGSKVSLLVVEPVNIQVFLKNEKGQTSTYDIDPDETVQGFKSKVYSRERIPVDQQRLIYQGKEMMNGKLTDYGVEALGTIYLTLRLRGG
ncbi:hypothetical protein WMY93_005005 [Mugilogobius chulae]|uniref:Ubiquitin-like domain-containing protein n=1 Tax=Mugilogobius chulae TaxID=88201 RepID=A0AAW0PSN2_9GOBI